MTAAAALARDPDTGRPDRPADLEPRLAARIAAGDYEAPVFPAVANRVLQLSTDASKGAAAVARLIERDPALCAKVLAAANSALYGGHRLASVKQAVARLGMNEVAVLAATVALKASAFRPGSYDGLLQECWRHSVVTGLFAKEVARVRRRGVDSAMLGGLLHRIGRPIALRLVAEESSGSCPESQAAALADRFQGELGTAAVRQWGLGAQVEGVVEHVDDLVPPDAHAEAVWTVQLGAEVSRWSAIRSDEPEQANMLASLSDTGKAAAALGMYPDDVDAVRARADAVDAALEAIS